MTEVEPAEQTSIQPLPVEHLRLDPDNPRLPEEMLGKSQPLLLTYLNDEEVLTELASSMLVNGFFEHEPLVVIGESDGSYTVVEGNRRFASLSILLQLPAAVEAEIEFPLAVEPEEFQLARLRNVPTLVVPDRDAVRKFLGYRHIGGLRTWSPESKARYLEKEVDRAIAEDASQDVFREVARRVGSTTPAVRGQYTTLKLLRAAKEVHELDVAFILKNRFGVWNRLLNNPAVREYIGFGSPLSPIEVDAAVQVLNVEGLKRVVSDLTPPLSGGKAVLSDSRDVTTYGLVLENPHAREALAQHKNLALAEQIVVREAIGEKLRTLTRNIDLFTQDLDAYDLDFEVESVARGLLGSARTLHAAIKERVSGED